MIGVSPREDQGAWRPRGSTSAATARRFLGGSDAAYASSAFSIIAAWDYRSETARGSYWALLGRAP